MKATEFCIWMISILLCLSPTLGVVPGHNDAADDFFKFKLDDYWRKRVEEADKNVLAAYHPQPLQITDGFNFGVHT